MTNKEIMKTLYINAEIAWAENHNGQSKSATVIHEGNEYVVFADDKPVLEEVQRRLEMSEWHEFNDWNDAPECSGVYVTIENCFKQRTVIQAWWDILDTGKCIWKVVDRVYAENWKEANWNLSHNWKVVAWMYRTAPYMENLDLCSKFPNCQDCEENKECEGRAFDKLFNKEENNG